MRILPWLALALLSWSSCLKELPLDAGQNPPATIVVSGDFTNSAGVHRLLLTRPNAYGTANYTVIKDAGIWVVDEASGQRGQYLFRSRVKITDPEFFYELPAGALAGVPGRSYYLEIELPGGAKYRSVPSVLPVPVAIDSMRPTGVLFQPSTPSGPGPVDPQVRVDLYGAMPGGTAPVYLRWDIFRVFHFQEFYRDPIPPKPQTYCFVHEFFNGQRLQLQKFENPETRPFSITLAQRSIDKTYENLSVFTAIQRSISADAYRFWQQVDQVANPSGTVFDPPPSAVRGNILRVDDPSETPLGYFEVASVDTVRMPLVTTWLGSEFAAPRYCVYSPPYYAYPGDECLECLTLSLSDYKKPWYWPQ